MTKQLLLKGLLTVSSIALLSACSPEENDTSTSESSTMESSMMDNTESTESGNGGMEDIEGMMHDDSGEIPTGLKEAENPTYEVGEEIILQQGHMEGMEGAEATVVGAFDTTAYEVSYDPTNGGERVENHRWVVHEEIADAGEESFEPGAEVTLEAKHMEGMEGATATIEDAATTTVYMVDYKPTDGGEVVRNHKWLTEEELAPK